MSNITDAVSWTQREESGRRLLKHIGKARAQAVQPRAELPALVDCNALGSN